MLSATIPLNGLTVLSAAEKVTLTAGSSLMGGFSLTTASLVSDPFGCAAASPAQASHTNPTKHWNAYFLFMPITSPDL
jgi:hypothetical protein